MPDTVVCAGYELQMSTVVSGGSGNYATYDWSAPAGTLSSADIPDPIFSTITPGHYNLAFSVTDNRGCMAKDSIVLYNDSPVSSFTSDAIPACSPLQVSFTNTSQGATDYEWNIFLSITAIRSNIIIQY